MKINHYIPQTAGLLRFLNTIEASQFTIARNYLDDNLEFVSRFYTPNINLSLASQRMLDNMQSGAVKVAESDYNTNTILQKVAKTGLEIQAPAIYKIFQSIVLEAFTLINCFTESPDLLSYMTQQDIKIVRENVNYIADYLSGYEEYDSIIKDLREMDIAFGYLEHQLPMIKRGQETDAV